MSYEMKDILKTMIDNNEPHWSADTMDMVRVEIHNVYAQATKADEYENNKYRTHVNDRKAEAFDAILKAYDEAFAREHMANEVSNIIEKYESGEYDAKK